MRDERRVDNMPNHPLEPGQSLQIQFEYVAAHLIRQGVRCSTTTADGLEECLYIGQNGLRCAAGCRVPDGATVKDGRTWSCVATKNTSLARYLNTELGDDLQDVHDLATPADWPRRLAEVADEYGLYVPQWIKERIEWI